MVRWVRHTLPACRSPFGIVCGFLDEFVLPTHGIGRCVAWQNWVGRVQINVHPDWWGRVEVDLQVLRPPPGAAGSDARVGREPGQVRKEAALSGPDSVPSCPRSHRGAVFCSIHRLPQTRIECRRDHDSVEMFFIQRLLCPPPGGACLPDDQIPCFSELGARAKPW